MGEVVDFEVADVYEVWFRETLHEQADATYEGIQTYKRAKHLAEKNVRSGLFRCAQMIGYKDSERVYEKVCGHIKGKLTWVDPW